jgi:GntR family transcriptional regulator
MAQLNVSLDRASDVPLGTQLAWRLRSAVASGAVAAGERLPGVREMAGLAGVNVNTVRSVYARLAEQGLIVSEHGRGTFVAPHLPPHDELSRLAGEVADSARHAGIDPHELAAALYAAPRDAHVDRAAAAHVDGPRTAGADRTAHGLAAADPPGSRSIAAEARRRAALRTEIAELERELAARELPGDAPAEPIEPHPDRRRRPAPQLLTAKDLEAVRDDLAARLRWLHADRHVAREERGREDAERVERDERDRNEPARRQRAIASSVPRFETGAGGWSLRWRD